MTNRYTYQNEQCTVKELAEIKGVKYDTMRRRVREWGIDKAMSAPVGKTTPHTATRYDYRGGKYTAAELGEMIGVNPVTMRSRLERNDGDVEYAMSLGPTRNRGGQNSIHRVGDRDMTVKEMAQEAGCSINAMRCRIARHESPEAAMRVQPQRGRNESGYDKKPRRSAGCPFDRVLQEARL